VPLFPSLAIFCLKSAENFLFTDKVLNDIIYECYSNNGQNKI